MPYTAQYSSTQRNPIGLILVAALHVAFFWALANGLKVRLPFAEPPPPLAAVMLPSVPQAPHEQPRATDPTRLKFEELIPQLPPIDPPEDSPLAREAVPDLSAVPTIDGSATEHEPVLSGAAVDPRSPLTQPPYPPAAIRANAEGKLALEVLVGTDGRVHDARVVRSSGFESLDQAAVNEARRHWKLRPATRDGLPFEQWYTLSVVFRLENR